MEIGHGSTASVHIANDPNGNKIAIKRLLSGTLAGVLTELAILQNVKHPNIIQLVDYSGCCGWPQIHLELADLSLFQAYNSNRNFDSNFGLRLGRDISSALKCLHSFNIAHRDIMPANIVLFVRGSHVPEFHKAKLIDFGIAHLASIPLIAIRHDFSRYSPPDLSDPKQDQTRIDIYGFGKVLLDVRKKWGHEHLRVLARKMTRRSKRATATDCLEWFENRLQLQDQPMLEHQRVPVQFSFKLGQPASQLEFAELLAKSTSPKFLARCLNLQNNNNNNNDNNNKDNKMHWSRAQAEGIAEIIENLLHESKPILSMNAHEVLPWVAFCLFPNFF